MYSASSDSNIRAWDIYTPFQKEKSLAPEPELRRKESLTPLQVDDASGAVKVPCLGIFQGHTEAVTCLEYHKDNIISGSSDKTIRVWTLKSKFYQEVSKGFFRDYRN